MLVNLSHDAHRTRLRRVREVPLDDDIRDRAAGSAHVTAPSTARASPESRVEDRDQLLAALRRLPERQRTAVVLRFWEELSLTETATLKGCTEGTVKSASSRGLARLRELLAPEPEPGPDPHTPRAPGAHALNPASRRER